MSDPIARLNAALEGRYTIERELGEGGMATVYLADDLKHERKVALKVLKPELAALVGAERFLAEIKTTANLQHPHILPLFDSGEADGFVFYVMPYVEGESLRDRLDREKQMGVKEAVAITQKVAGALDYAHGNGVVHRDIKPGNILLSAQGEPLVADFGIALAVAQAGGGRITETGLSLGTPHYMSPEQATGDRDVDPRSDVFALGCVLYEMLAGQPPFAAPTAQAVLVQILTTDAPSITTQRRTVAPNVAAALAQALEKLPADRFTSAAEFTAALGDETFTYQTRPRTPVATPTHEVPVVSTEGAGIDRRAFSAIAMVAVVAIALAAWGWLRPPPQALAVYATRLPIDLDEIALGPFENIVVSPDGSRFAVTGFVEGERALYWRSADEESFRVVPGTQGARGASFSPDGDWIAYGTVEAALYKVSLSGGAPALLVRAGLLSAGVFIPHWGDDGTIVFANPTGSFRVPDTGGEYVPLSESEPFIHPHLLPGGWAVLGSRIAGGVVLLDLAAGTIRELNQVGFKPKYVETGHLLYVDGSGGLWALPFDAANGDVLGDAVPILDGVSNIPSGGYFFPRYSVSRNGTLAYAAGGGAGAGVGGLQLLVVDLEGNEEPLVLTPRDVQGVNWSPDGQSVVYQSVAEGDQDSDIYTYNVELGTTPRQLTFEGINISPVFSADGTRVVFASQREGTDGFDLFVKTLGDDVPARSLITLAGGEYPTQWPSDSLIVFEQGPNPTDLWMLDLSDPDSPRAEVYLPLEADLDDIVVSRDGTLAAYLSDETGADEVYIRSFPEPGERTLVSQGGGQYPFWSPDGNTVFYWRQGAGQDIFMAARLRRNPTPVVLSRDSLFSGDYVISLGTHLHPDGDRVVVPQPSALATAPEGATTRPERFIVVTNWFEELRGRMGN
jgi:serine/threonine-protein kinase